MLSSLGPLAFEMLLLTCHRDLSSGRCGEGFGLAHSYSVARSPGDPWRDSWPCCRGSLCHGVFAVWPEMGAAQPTVLSGQGTHGERRGVLSDGDSLRAKSSPLTVETSTPPSCLSPHLHRGLPQFMLRILSLRSQSLLWTKWAHPHIHMLKC